MEIPNISENHHLGSPGTSHNVFGRVQNTIRSTLSSNALGQEFRESWNLAWWSFSGSQIYAIGDIINRLKSGLDEYNSRLCARGICLERSDYGSGFVFVKRRSEIWTFSWWSFSRSQIYAFGDIKNQWKPGVDKYNCRLCARGIYLEPISWA